MTLIKMQYGIDLGTTNSAICKIDNGAPVILKSDTLKDTLPSCVAFTRKQIVKVGDSAYNDNRSEKARATKKWSENSVNVFQEFKRTMGLDTAYFSSNMNRSFSSEELSAEVLKTLKSFVREKAVTATVITVPAKFKSDQIAATRRAATLAGISHCELLQEPVAAAMAYGLKATEKDGRWLVFDFGGGTFDAALLSAEEGILQVKDTEGDNYLGGKNLDYAIVDDIIIPYLQREYSIDGILSDDNKKQILREALKFYAEQAKNQLSFKENSDITSQIGEFGEDDDGEELELDLVISRDDVRPILEPFFQKAINICLDLLRRNNLTGQDLTSLILVGGPTRSTILREMLQEQLTPKVDTNIDPMTAVAVGAALFATTVDTEADVKLDNVSTVASFEVHYESNSVETEEFVTLKMLKDQSKGITADSVMVELIRSDGAWSSGRIRIGEIGDVVECSLLEGKPNQFKIMAFDETGGAVKCFPEEINIIQGTKVGNAVLPYSIGVEVTDERKHKDVFIPLKGLEKNQYIPAVGVRNGLRTPKTLNPGNSSDRLVIPVYQGEYDSEGTRACYNDHVFDVIITGEDVPAQVPADSELDITLKVDRSQMMTLEVMFPVIGETVEKSVDVKCRQGVTLNEVQALLSEACSKFDVLKSSEGISERELAEANVLLRDTRDRYESEKNSEDGRMHLLADLRRVLLMLDKVEDIHADDILTAEIRELLDKIIEANEILNYQYDSEVEKARRIANSALTGTKPREYMNEVKETLEHIRFSITLIYQFIGLGKHISEDFDTIKWKDRARALSYMDKLNAELKDPSLEGLRSVLRELLPLMDIPEGEKPKL